MSEINFKIGHMMMLYDEPKQSDQNYKQRCAKYLGHHQAKNNSFFYQSRISSSTAILLSINIAQ